MLKDMVQDLGILILCNSDERTNIYFSAIQFLEIVDNLKYHSVLKSNLNNTQIHYIINIYVYLLSF